ncbi:hypothetical protein EZV62_004165 [Acer yangbiense]|uniref:Uncharacterized protein n=1 Tax=Acer yangbiense TaxID=1000413 RepID=A0A5C7IIY0_9ROSI|nr:hypothetical protein EZV62_004165 [Acer yangbiense]
MECVNPILDIVKRLWDCTANRAVYIRDLQDILNTLKDLKHDLEDISKDVEGRADLVEQQQYAARTNQVIRWLESVQHKLKEPMIDEMPMEKTVGMNSMFDEVWKCVEDQIVGIIGLYGEVCCQMGAKKRIKLNGLPQEAALRLFRQNVGEDVLNAHHELPKLAEIVAEECDSLPLALVTIGRAMASRTTPEDWSLKLACLLEESCDKDIRYEGEHVKMHDVLCDMAHWLAHEHGNEILVKEHAGLINSQGIGRWKEVVRVSLCGDSTKFIIETPVVCPRLKTIFVMDSTLTALPDTCVSDLPIEIKNFTQLRILLLDRMNTKQVVIPQGVISSLSSLEMYSSIKSSSQCKMDMELIIEELECLEKITDVSITFLSVSPVLKFMSSNPKLQSCITRLSIHRCEELHSIDISYSTMSRMEHLEELDIMKCPNLREVKICFENGERMKRSEPNCFRNLQILNIWKCALENLTWLRYTPRLRFLDVTDCESLEEIIAWDFAGSLENLLRYSQILK